MIETSGFAIKNDSANVGIVSERLSECRFPFVTVAMCLQANACVQRIANGLGIVVKRFLTVVRIFTFQEIERKTEAERAVILIDNIERTMGSIKFLYSSFIFH